MYNNKLIKIFFIAYFLILNCSIAISEPLKLSEWKQPYLGNEIFFHNYTSVLNCNKKTPYYVYYNLDTHNFSPAVAKRVNRWPNTISVEINNICGYNYATSKDYSNSGYDRGHLAPAVNFKASQQGEDETFSFANAAPQNPVLNRKYWAQTEKYERKMAIEHNGVTIITGIIQSKNKYIKNKVGVPDYFYKIILWKENATIKNIAFIAQNNSNSYPKEINIKDLESLSGLNFGF